MEKIKNVSDFIEKVDEFVGKFPEDEIIVYRGEDRVFSEPCMPNIFRKQLLCKDNYFEKNLLESMRQNNLSMRTTYLYNAIDAQHGEFPSRLLDVTYNCLVALYFAVTPFYKYTEDSNDTEDGSVYLFHSKSAYNPCSENIDKCYESIILRKDSVFSNNIIFGKNHKLIDHCKINNRIIAQQGAFILFQGDAAEPLPKYLFDRLIISAEYKFKIRKELKVLFGIHTGSIYPEINNFVDELSEKSKKIITKEYTNCNELDDILEVFEEELLYYVDHIIMYKSKGKEKESVRCAKQYARLTEKMLYSYYLGICQLNEYIKNNEVNESAINSKLDEFIDHFNQKLNEYEDALKKYKIEELNLSQFIIARS